MSINIILDYLIISTFISMAINYLANDYARKKNLLIDLPDKSRKFHTRSTPLTGGVAIFIALLISGKLYIDLNQLNGFMPNFTFYLVVSSIPLLILFLLDDFKGLKPLVRILIQILLNLFMIIKTDVKLVSFGDLFGLGEISLGFLIIPITIFCVVGIMNAFNMIDGINGLCAGCAMVSLLFMGFYSGLIYDSMMILVIGSIIGFLIFNLRIFGKKRGVFLGDSGSNLIGFWVAWSAIYSSQNITYEVEPITMIWFVAIPLLDCIGLIFFRISTGVGISSPGRDHIHHRLMNRYSPEGSLIIILIITILTSSMGVYLNNNFKPFISTFAFLLYAFLYYLTVYYFISYKKGHK